MKKFISILLVFCLSGCTVLDFVAEDTQNQTLNTYNYDYKETNTTTESQTPVSYTHLNSLIIRINIVDFLR